MNLEQMIKDCLDRNENKLTPQFIDEIAYLSKAVHSHPTENTRICVLILPTGHELVGVAQVLDVANDVESIGQSVAFGNAKEQLWKLCGTIAKLYI